MALSATGGNPVMIDHFDFEDAGSNADRVSHASPSLQLSTDTAGKGPACSLPCLSSGAFSCLSDTAEKGPAVSTATLQKS